MRGLGTGLGLTRAAAGYHGLPPLGTVDYATSVFVTGATFTSLTGTENSVLDDYLLPAADRLVEAAVNDVHAVSPAAVFAGAVNLQSYTADLVVKPNGRNCILFQVSGTTNNASGRFDLSAKTIGTSVGLTSWTITDLSNGWKQVRMVFTATATEAVGLTVFLGFDLATFGYLGDITKDIYLARATISH